MYQDILSLSNNHPVLHSSQFAKSELRNYERAFLQPSMMSQVAMEA
jgi:hypothetical protein